jgi:hypothetical protein
MTEVPGPVRVAQAVRAGDATGTPPDGPDVPPSPEAEVEVEEVEVEVVDAEAEAGGVTVALDAALVDVEDDEEMTDAWHRALLGLAGFLPDDLISEARAWLAAGLRVDLAQSIAFAVAAGQLSIGGEEILLAREELTAAGHESDLVGALDALPLGERIPTAWVFRSGDPMKDGPVVSLPVDLTTRAGTIGLDVVDAAIVEAVRAEPDAIGVWRAWRLPAGGVSWPRPKRVFVVTAERRSAAAAALVARLQAALSAAGEPDPQVEVCPAGMDTPSYQGLAQVYGALLWAREPADEVLVARVFDGVDPEEGPRFDADRPRIDDLEHRERLLAYLDVGIPIIATSSLMQDIVDPARGEVVPLTFRTDGRWVWTDATSYYLDEHGIAPDPDLARYVEHGRHPERVDDVALHRVLAHLLSAPQGQDGVWLVPQLGAALPDAEATIADAEESHAPAAFPPLDPIEPSPGREAGRAQDPQ